MVVVVVMMMIMDGGGGGGGGDDGRGGNIFIDALSRKWSNHTVRYKIWAGSMIKWW